MSKIRIDQSIPIYAEYFHAIALNAAKNIFKTNSGVVNITPDSFTEPYDIIDKIINPLKANNLIKEDGENLLVALEGLLVVPNSTTNEKFPLVIIGHGNHLGYFTGGTSFIKPKPASGGNPAVKGVRDWAMLAKKDWRLSFNGYEEFQDYLATKKIASYSLNLNLANNLENNEIAPFDKMALDFNQRVLLMFLSLKLLKIIGGEQINSSSTEELPIKFFDGSSLRNFRDAFASTGLTSNPTLQPLKSVAFNKIDFTRLGFMGHSRGADAVSRIPAYFYKGTVADNPSFPINAEVNTRIRKLSEQIGRPIQDTIKCILALEPVATTNEVDPAKHGYTIENGQTMFFVGVGTHDEDVSLDSVRIYEYPQCFKAMIAINGATHKRFNTVWAPDEQKDEFGQDGVSLNLLDVGEHTNILKKVYGSCFIATLGGAPSHLQYFTREREFPINLPKRVSFQSAWKFGYPFQTPGTLLTDLDAKVAATPTENLSTSSFPFEQDIKSFYVEKDNAGTFTLKIPVDAATNENLSRYTHFSFRFAKGFDISSDANRVEQKNFTIQFFENDTGIGKQISGKDLTTPELSALRAFDGKNPRAENGSIKMDFIYSILLQTVEITLSDYSSAELNKINRIEISVIPDTTKPAPNSPITVGLGSTGGAIAGGLIGVGGAAIFNAKTGQDEDKSIYILIGSGLAGTVAGGLITRHILKGDKDAFAFKDFLLTNRQIP